MIILCAKKVKLGLKEDDDDRPVSTTSQVQVHDDVDEGTFLEGLLGTRVMTPCVCCIKKLD